MAVLRITEYPEEILLHASVQVDFFDSKLAKIANDMLETMYVSNGAGLAANQVNLPYNMFVMDISRNKSEPYIIVNPKISEQSGEQISMEGCLSFPGIGFEVARPARVILEYQDLNGQPCQLIATEFMAKCVSHEIEHLSGRVFIQNLSPLKRERILKKFNKLQRAAQGK